MVIRERSAGAIIYRESEGNIYYLLLKYGEGHWDYPKGHVEKGENDKQAMLREVKEETGITDLTMISGFSRTINYYYKREGNTYFKEVIFFLVKTYSDEVKLSHEHEDYKWLLYSEAENLVTFRNAKLILEQANEFLKPKA